MQKIKHFQNFVALAGLLISLIVFSSCNRPDYELLDPETAGVWTLFDTEDGLPGNSVSDINRDSKDNLWFTFSGQGAAMYSEGIWINYRTANSPLLDNVVSSVAETSEGNILFGTAGGVSILTTTAKWESFLDPVTTLVVSSLKVASDGSVWVGTSYQGYYVDRGSGFEKVYNEKFRSVNVFEEDNEGNIWIGTETGLIKWNGTSYSYLTQANGLPDNRITSLHNDSKKRLWIGTRGGKTVSWLDKEGMHKLSLLTGRDSCIVNDIFEDRRGHIWFATKNDGLVQYDGIIPRSYKTSNGFPENSVRSIGEDKNGNLWFGLESKGVVKHSLSIE